MNPSKEVVRSNLTSCSCEILKAAFWWFPLSRTGDLHDVDIPGPGAGGGPGEGELVAVVASLQDHVVPRVRPTDYRGSRTVGTGGELGVYALSSLVGNSVPWQVGAGLDYVKAVKAQPDLTNVTRTFTNFKLARRALTAITSKVRIVH